jgi:hypothetical protein
MRVLAVNNKSTNKGGITAVESAVAVPAVPL